MKIQHEVINQKPSTTKLKQPKFKNLHKGASTFDDKKKKGTIHSLTTPYVVR